VSYYFLNFDAHTLGTLEMVVVTNSLAVLGLMREHHDCDTLNMPPLLPGVLTGGLILDAITPWLN
jgi:hypothetical protein